MSHVFYETLEKRANLRSRIQGMARSIKQRFSKPKPDLVGRFKAQQQARSVMKKSRLQDAMSAMKQRAAGNSSGNLVDRFKQQTAARAALKKQRLQDAMNNAMNR